jgi:hypothetical protein
LKRALLVVEVNMNKFKNILAMLLILGTCVATVISSSNASNAEKARSPELQFKVKPINPRFKLGEPVALDFTLKNMSQRPVLVARFIYPSHATVHLTGPDGKPVPWKGSKRIVNESYPPDAFVVLASGEMFSRQATISLEKEQGYVITSPGKYVVWAEYSLGPPEYFAAAAKGALVPKGSFQSTPVSFLIQ